MIAKFSDVPTKEGYAQTPAVGGVDVAFPTEVRDLPNHPEMAI